MRLLATVLVLLLIGCGTRRDLHSFHFPPGKTLPSTCDTNRFRALRDQMLADTGTVLVVNGNLWPPNQRLTDDRTLLVLDALWSSGIDLGRVYLPEPFTHYRSHVPNNQWFTLVLVYP